MGAQKHDDVDALLERLRTLPAANVGDAMQRLSAVDSGIRPVWSGARLVAPAFTILTRSGDNLAIHEALALAQPGDVVVVNGFGDVTRALVGELVAGRALARGLAGFVIDGAVRDVAAIKELGLPVFARAVTPAGPYKMGPFRHQVPIALGGQCVLPGDIVVGDDDGVVVIARSQLGTVVAGAEEIRDVETGKRRAIS